MFPTVIDSTVTTTGYQYKHTFRCPNRYDLIVSDIVKLECKELDNDLNRGKQARSVMPLGEFFLSSPGMNESTFQKDIPDRPMAPRTLNQLNFSFTRDSTSTKEADETGDINRKPYNFRGVRWFIKLAVKTLEIPNVMHGFDQNKQPKFAEVNIANFKAAVQSMQNSNDIPNYAIFGQRRGWY